MMPGAPDYEAAMEAVEEVRLYFSDPANHPARIGPGSSRYEAALTVLRRTELRMLYPLELIVLEESENPFVRGAILDLLARHTEEAMRQFLSGLFSDPREHEYMRSKALDHLGSYGGSRNFRILHEVFEFDSEFQDRVRLVFAMGATKSEQALPLLFALLAQDQPLEIRAIAAQGLGFFAERLGVRERLMLLARGDPFIPVRQNALGVLALLPGREIDEFLTVLSERPEESEVIRKTARSWLSHRNP
jgi:HEAT repeat protein